MTRGIWTYRYIGDTWTDKFAKKLWRLGLFKTYSAKPMMDYATGEEAGKFITIYGNWLAVRLVDKLTEPKVRAKDRRNIAKLLKNEGL